MASNGSHVEERNWMLPYGVTLATISTIVIALRLYSRLPRQLGLDDFFIALAWMLSTVSTALTIWICTDYGFNRHIWDVPLALWPGAIKGTFVVSLVGVGGTSCTKVSILLFYRRLVDGVVSRRLKWSLWSAILFVVLYTIGFMAFTLAQCTPIQSSWEALDPTYRGAYKCVSPRAIQVSATTISAISVVTDFVTVTLPAILLFTKTQIKFSRNQRIALLVIFGLGYLTVGAGIARTIYLTAAVDPLEVDESWVGFNGYVAGLAEANLGFICACAPSLNRLFGRFFRDSDVNGSKYNMGSNSGPKRSEKTSPTIQNDEHSESSGAVDELEEVDMRFYGKSLNVDHVGYQP